MADDDRRGLSVADADSSQPSENKSDNPQTSEKPTETGTHPDVNATQPAHELDDKKVNCSEQDPPKPSTDGLPSTNRDSEETRNRLAKVREELNRAKEESARARDEVEKAKKDLAVAKQDTSSVIQAVVEQEKQPALDDEKSNLNKELEVEKEVINESTNSPNNSESLDTIPDVSGHDDTVQPPQSAQLDSSKEETLLLVDSETNQAIQVDKSKENNGEEQQALPTAQESQIKNELADDKVAVEDRVSNTDNTQTAGSKNDDDGKPVIVSEENPASVQSEEEMKEGNASDSTIPVVCESAEDKSAEDGKDGQGDQVVEVAEVVEGEPEPQEDELAEGEIENDHDEGELVEGEREEGDGEESGDEGAAAKPLDDDEDRRNPQYIPKRGGFYEHDDRTREEEGEEAAVEEPVAEEKPKKNRSEAIDRWGHDMFDPTQQGPKSDQELVDLYGYDIRQEEGAPRARRRRRYGRGPNKYDRTWEDEDAYSRPRGRGGAAPRGGPSERGAGDDRNTNVRPRPRQEVPRKEEFPALSDQHQEPKAQGEPNIRNSSSANWRETEGGRGAASADRRGGSSSSKANAISFRRGGGGRTFEEPNKAKGVKPRSENSNSSQTGQVEEDNTAESAPKDNLRSPRRPPAEPSRGGASRGTGNRGGGPSRGGAVGLSPRGRGAPSSRGRRNGDNSNWNKDDESSNRPGGSQHAFSRGSGGPHGAHMDNRGPYEEHRGRGRGKFGRSLEGNQANSDLVGGVEQMRIEEHPAPSSVSRNQDGGRSKRYSSQRQRMTTPPPANTGAPIQQPPYPVAGSGTAAFYASYNDSPPPNYVSAAPAPLLPMAVAAQGAPPAFIAQPMYPAGPGPAPFNAGPYQGYSPAAAPPAVPVGVPIGSPTQDNMYGGGIMYYDPGRQPIRHGAQPTRRAKAAIPIVAPDNDVDSYLISGRRPNHE